MSCSILICRACLTRNSRMYRITNTELQATFEKLSGATLITNDGKPNTICYICLALLQKCWKFGKISQEANNHLMKFLHNGGIEPAQGITMLDAKIKYTLTITTPKLVSTADDYIKSENSKIFVKEEANGHENDFAGGDQIEGDSVAENPVHYESRETKVLKEELSSSDFKDNTLFVHDEEFNIEATVIETKLKTRSTNSSVTRDSMYSCDTCNRKFKQYTYLQNHMARHLKSFSCSKSFESFINQNELHKKHYEVKTGGLHICDICNKAYISKHSLQVHISHKHLRLAKKEPYNCDICNKTFNHRGTLRLHMRIHTGDKPYACDKCPKSFSQKGTLQRHNRMHTGEKPYVCHKCTKTFNQESSLKRHIKMHNGEKSYACSRCDKAYYESSHLTRHMRTHTGEKPYACDRCFQTFSQSSNLHAHMKKHTGTKASNFTCHECNKTFDHKSIFNRHVLKHTQEKPYPCDQCEKRYADKRTLQRHIATHS